jgi:peptidoglycan hydrolase CwlO-like protein
VLDRRAVLGCSAPRPEPPSHAAPSPPVSSRIAPGPVTLTHAPIPMSLTPTRPGIVRVALTRAVLGALLGSGLTARSAGDLRGQITAKRSAADALKAQIDADSRQIAATTNGLQTARDRLAAVQSTLDRRVNELRGVQTALLTARNHLVDLENELQAATTALSANLVANYEGGKPDLVSVILDSHGFGDLLEQVGFMQRIAHQDGRIVGTTRTARAEVSREATRLQGLEARDRSLANQVLDQRNQVAALQAALSRRQIAQMSQRGAVSGRYHAVSAQLSALQSREQEQEKRAAEAAVRAAATGNADVGGITLNTGGMVQAPAGAPEAVKQIIAAGNAIATLPYIYGGGHGSFHADGYDCSGSVSYALAAAGLVSSPMVSGAYENWGAAGPGRWVTLYANAGHIWMEVAGWRFDTVALAESGTRWARGGGEFSGFVVRHPPGL